MNITDRLLSLDPTLQLHNESEWSGGEEAKLYSAFNSGGIECETGEFLYGFVRLLKPDHVLETGTHFGIGASYMGMALKDNGKGTLDTVEFLREIYDKAVGRFFKLGLENIVIPHFGDVAKFDPRLNIKAGFDEDCKYQLILLDTEPQTRFAELIKFFPFLAPGGFVFIHDLHRHMHQIPNEEHGFAWPYGILPEQIKNWVKDGELRPFHFSTPRGITGFYKTHPNDYKFL